MEKLEREIRRMFRSRIGRKDYFVGSVGLCAISWLGGAVLSVLVYGGILGWALHYAWWALSLLVAFSLSVRRLHDLGYDGLLALFLLVPGINILFWLFLLFVDGEKGENKYGPARKYKNFMNILFNK